MSRVHREQRILILNHEYPPIPGGASILTGDLVSEIAKEHRAVVVTSGCAGAPRHEKLDGIEVYRVPCFGRRSDQLYPTILSLATYVLFALPRVFALARKYEVVFIHSFAVIAGGVVGHIAGRLLRVPHFCTIIGADIYSPIQRRWLYRNRLYRLMVRRILNRARHVVSLSTEIKKQCRSIYKFDKPITVIAPPISASFCSLPREQSNEANGEIRICSISRLVKRKSLDTILEAVAHRNDPALRYFVAGMGEERERLAETARRLGIEEQVRFVGHVPHAEVVSFVRQTKPHVFVLVSHHEGFGLAYLEAMACGLPVIAGDQGGQTDFIVDGENGYLVPVGDSRAVADRIRFLKEHPAVRAQLAARAYATAQEFTPARIANQYRKVYEEHG